MKSQLIDNKKPLFLELQLVNTMASVYACTSRQTQTHTHAHNISTHTHMHTHIHPSTNMARHESRLASGLCVLQHSQSLPYLHFLGSFTHPRGTEAAKFCGKCCQCACCWDARGRCCSTPDDGGP